MTEKIKSSRLRTDGLDFNQIKTNLKDHLRSYPEFTDYDFEGSALSTLIDVLAYNTHYLGMYAHVAANEAFIDSAMKRSSVVSIAKALGYTPRSLNAPKAVINLRVNAISGSPPTITLPKGVNFTTSISGQTFNFTNIDEFYAPKVSGQYLFENVEIYQGRLLNYKFVVTEETGAGVFYRIPNKNVDTNKIRVRVQENQQSTNYESFYRPEFFTEIDGNTPAYFIQETFDGFYEIEFGDGVLGKRLQAGNLVLVEYLVTENTGNGLNSFQTSWNEYGSATVIPMIKAFGGNDIESTESVRFAAPKFYESQNRAVTTNDYQSIISNNYANINSVAVWGGEDNNPPIYGKVFISIDTINGEPLTEGARADIKNNIVRKYNMVSVIPEVINPELILLNLNLRVAYDPSKTILTNSELQALISDSVRDYFTDRIQRHNTSLYHSKLTRFVDDLDGSILSTDPEIVMCLLGNVTLNSTRSYEYQFYNEIEPGTVTSSKFSYFNNLENIDVYLYDDRSGTLRLKRNTDNVTLTKSVGTVDYKKGLVKLNDLRVSGYSVPVRFYAAPRYDDVYVQRNIILKLNNDSFDVLNKVQNSLIIRTTAIQE